jgi:LysR family cys regulon transcriptional activator
MRQNINLSQLRALVAVYDCDLNVTAAAAQLQTAQPAVSKNLLSLERQIGGLLFVRNGKRLVRPTHLCKSAVKMARLALLQCDNIVRQANSAAHVAPPPLAIGATHTQACYVLPPVLAKFFVAMPHARVNIRQGSPRDLSLFLEGNRIDMAICSEEIFQNSNFRATPALPWNRCLVGSPRHPLFASSAPITLRKLAQIPLVTYVDRHTGRGSFDAAFARAGLTPNVVVAAADSDVIKTYVRAGFGCGVLSDLAWDEKQDADLAMRSLARLFPQMWAGVAHLRDKFVTPEMRAFMEIFVSHMRERAAANGADAGEAGEAEKPAGKKRRQ